MRAVPVARRNLLADRRRLAIGTLGVGLAIALMLLLEGLWGGVLAGITAYPDRAGATFFVREPDAMALAKGAVPLSERDQTHPRCGPGRRRDRPLRHPGPARHEGPGERRRVRPRRDGGAVAGHRRSHGPLRRRARHRPEPGRRPRGARWPI